jgi:histidinol-phosphate aminotransferase
VGTEEVNLDRNDFSLSADKFQSLSPNSKVIFLCTPNNPTGNLLTRDSIEEIAKNNSDKLIAIDEAYIDFSSERGDNRQTGNMGLISKYPNIIILRTLSKAYGAAGVRFGYGVASTDVIEVLKKVIAPYPIPRPCVSIIRKVLESEEKIKCLVEDIIEQRKFLEGKLSNLSFVHRVFPSDANFLLVKVSDSKLLCKELAELGIILRDRSSQVNLENCVRISVGNKEENANLILALMQFQLRSEKRGE